MSGVPKQPCPGVGNKLVRLADIPKDERLKAARLLSRTAKTDAEAMRIFVLAAEPGDAGGRIAA